MRMKDKMVEAWWRTIATEAETFACRLEVFLRIRRLRRSFCAAHGGPAPCLSVEGHFREYLRPFWYLENHRVTVLLLEIIQILVKLIKKNYIENFEQRMRFKEK